MNDSEIAKFLKKIEGRDKGVNINIKHTNGHMTTLALDSDGNCDLKEGFANETIIKLINVFNERAFNIQQRKS